MGKVGDVNQDSSPRHLFDLFDKFLPFITVAVNRVKQWGLLGQMKLLMVHRIPFSFSD
jgi:hypothetical protein